MFLLIFGSLIFTNGFRITDCHVEAFQSHLVIFSSSGCKRESNQVIDSYNLIVDFPRDIKILGWCPAGPVLPRGEKVPL